MTVKNTQAIILAAGKSTRFNTGKSKLLERICGQEMILYLTKLFESMHMPTVAVVGFQKEQVMETVTQHHGDGVTFIEQTEQRGTGHALQCTRHTWNQENILVVNGDMPLITHDIIEQLYEKHTSLNAAISFVVAHQSDPALGAYGRLVTTGGRMEIVEARDFTADPVEHCFINAGIYLISRAYLEIAIDSIIKRENTKEFYIIDLIKIASDAGKPVGTITVPFDQVRGINTMEELWSVDQIKKAELIKHWMQQGVRFYATHNLHIDVDVTIGAGTYIGCGTHIVRGTKIGKNCKINEYTSIYNTEIGDNVVVYPFTMITDSTIGDNVHVGPFAHIRNNAQIHNNATVGNFVEIKNSRLGDGVQAKHLSYLGDAEIGASTNIGAGTITCNYDGVKKHTTTVQENCFIGSNNTLVAPVTIHKNSYTAAGSVITEDVPENSLALGRARQVVKEGYAHELRERLNSGSQETSSPAFVKQAKGKQDIVV